MTQQKLEPQRDAFALMGRVVTMNDTFEVIEDGILYIQHGVIQAIARQTDPPPSGFQNAPKIQTAGIIFPGMIELHNHLSYNIMPMWQVPEQFEDRDKWKNNKQLKARIKAPVAVLGQTKSYPEAIVRYVESKCLVSGVTSTQGIKLFSADFRHLYQGVVRNVEAPSNPKLPQAHGKTSDLNDAQIQELADCLQKIAGTFLYHLSEGVTDKSRQHFTALQLNKDTYAVNNHFAGIHSTALLPEDFKIMADRHAAIIWSPLSNLNLYGETTNIAAAYTAGITLALGADWSPTGSKNLLGELKVAHLVISENQIPIPLHELVAMVTSNPAKILHWESHLGSLSAGKLADLLIISDSEDNPYEALIRATEKDVNLVVINGIPRYGIPDIMQNFGSETERIGIARHARWLNLRDDNVDEPMQNLTLTMARQHLEYGLQNISTLAQQLPATLKYPSYDRALCPQDDEQQLAIDRDYSANAVYLDLAEDLPDGDLSTMDTQSTEVAQLEVNNEYPSIVATETYRLDPLTVPDDPTYFTSLEQQKNLPSYIKRKLPPLYGEPISTPDIADFA